MLPLNINYTHTHTARCPPKPTFCSFLPLRVPDGSQHVTTHHPCSQVWSHDSPCSRQGEKRGNISVYSGKGGGMPSFLCPHLQLGPSSWPEDSGKDHSLETPRGKLRGTQVPEGLQRSPDLSSLSTGVFTRHQLHLDQAVSERLCFHSHT